MKSTVGCVLISNRNKTPDLETLEQLKVQSQLQQLGCAAGTRQRVRSGSPMEEPLGLPASPQKFLRAVVETPL